MSVRWRTGLILTLAVGVAAAATGLGAVAWTATDRLEQSNEFCLGCHLERDVRLHAAIGRDFAGAPPTSLAALHASVSAERRHGEEFRCADCHGGTSWPGRARVKLLAAQDAFWYFADRFSEPTSMDWPLWDEDCRKCHADFDTTRSEDELFPRFHELMGHNEALGVGCVECHRAHVTAGDPNRAFLEANHLKTQCARCHSEFRDDQR
jgi:nitrate/TMAO reductase-like tetraheme cytochrome c subunit